VSGRPLLVVEHESDAGPGRLAPFLGPLDVCRPYAGDALPAGLDGHAGLVVLGGEVSAWDDEKAPWLPATRVLLARATAAGLPVLGVCLGAQLLAMACGGRAEPGGVGLEVGLTAVRVLPAGRGDPLLAGVLGAMEGTPPAVPPDGDFVAPQYHRDAITQLPPDAELLATGDIYGVQAFRVGETAWGVQYHPEVTDDDFAAWTDSGRASLVAAGHDPAALLGSVTSRSAYLDLLAAGHGDGFSWVTGPEIGLS
jgi:GMP synthase-like glutamine amidotransferase